MNWFAYYYQVFSYLCLPTITAITVIRLLGIHDTFFVTFNFFEPFSTLFSIFYEYRMYEILSFVYINEMKILCFVYSLIISYCSGWFIVLKCTTNKNTSHRLERCVVLSL